MDHDALFAANMTWAKDIARSIHRTLPASFDLADLEQIAMIETWKQAPRYNPATNDSFRGFAYLAVRGAVLMACRRRNWREATAEPLERATSAIRDLSDRDQHAAQEARRTEWREQRRKRLLKLKLPYLPVEDATVLRAVLVDGQTAAQYAVLIGKSEGEVRRLLGYAIRRMKKRQPGLSLRAKQLRREIEENGMAPQRELARRLFCSLPTIKRRMRELRCANMFQTSLSLNGLDRNVIPR